MSHVKRKHDGNVKLFLRLNYLGSPLANHIPRFLYMRPEGKGLHEQASH
jgi:hypothetical protein